MDLNNKRIKNYLPSSAIILRRDTLIISDGKIIIKLTKNKNGHEESKNKKSSTLHNTNLHTT